MGVEAVLLGIGAAVAAAGTAYNIKNSEKRKSDAEKAQQNLLSKGTVTGGGFPQGSMESDFGQLQLQTALDEIESSQQVKQQNETFTANTNSHTVLTYTGVAVLGVVTYAIAKKAKLI